MTLLVSVLVATVLQWLAVAVARRFLRQHRERPLAAVWPRLRLLGPGFVLLAGGLAWLEMSAVDLLFSLTGGAFLALFIYLDVASRCLPQCFTVAFALTGGLWRLLVHPESVLLAAATAGGRRALRSGGCVSAGGAGAVVFLSPDAVADGRRGAVWRRVFAGAPSAASSMLAAPAGVSHGAVCAVSVWRGSAAAAVNDARLM